VTSAACPYPANCPVPDPDTLDLRRLRIHRVEPGATLHNVVRGVRASATFNNAGVGSARFSPIIRPDGSPVGHIYLGRTTIAALLETTFHDIGPGRTNQIDAAVDLQGWRLRSVELTRPLRMADLRDTALEGMGLSRHQLVTTPQAHYECSREWAHRIRSSGRSVDGLIWRSRVAEIASSRSLLLAAIDETDYADALVLYDDRVDHSDLIVTVDTEDLASPLRRALVDEIADALDMPIL